MDRKSTAGRQQASRPTYRHRFTYLTDLLIPAYDRLFRVLGGQDHDLFREHVSALACPGAGERLLDAGCGTGLTLMKIAAQCPGCTLHGLDISPGMISAAQRSAAAAGVPVDLRVGTVTHLPYEDGSFDVVVTTIMFHHLALREKRQAVGEIARVLKPGGRYVSAEFGPRARNWIERRLAKGEHTLYPAHLAAAGLALEHEELGSLSRLKKVVYRVAARRTGLAPV